MADALYAAAPREPCKTFWRSVSRGVRLIIILPRRNAASLTPGALQWPDFVATERYSTVGLDGNDDLAIMITPSTTTTHDNVFDDLGHYRRDTTGATGAAAGFGARRDPLSTSATALEWVG